MKGSNTNMLRSGGIEKRNQKKVSVREGEKIFEWVEQEGIIG